jgi:hypothetical protein
MAVDNKEVILRLNFSIKFTVGLYRTLIDGRDFEYHPGCN